VARTHRHIAEWLNVTRKRKDTRTVEETGKMVGIGKGKTGMRLLWVVLRALADA